VKELAMAHFEARRLDPSGQRVKLICVSLPALMEMFAGTRPGRWMRFRAAIPSDGRVVGTDIDACTRTVRVAVESEEFPPVPEGGALEQVYVEVEVMTVEG
jgi:hypothetical protein